MPEASECTTPEPSSRKQRQADSPRAVFLSASEPRHGPEKKLGGGQLGVA